jgi:hypothetical protein
MTARDSRSIRAGTSESTLLERLNKPKSRRKCWRIRDHDAPKEPGAAADPSKRSPQRPFDSRVPPLKGANAGMTQSFRARVEQFPPMVQKAQAVPGSVARRTASDSKQPNEPKSRGNPSETGIASGQSNQGPVGPAARLRVGQDRVSTGWRGL